jgi:hypothetical protein
MTCDTREMIKEFMRQAAQGVGFSSGHDHDEWEFTTWEGLDLSPII